MLPLMHMHEGLLNTWCNFWQKWIIMALEPARVITKVRASDFLFLHEKDFWFKQMWLDLHQTILLDRPGSYTRPVIGLVRFVCKDETDQTGRTSPIKMRICNLHFFASIEMAQPCAQLSTYEHGRSQTQRTGILCFTLEAVPVVAGHV